MEIKFYRFFQTLPVQIDPGDSEIIEFKGIHNGRNTFYAENAVLHIETDFRGTAGRFTYNRFHAASGLLSGV
jgi:hypothetical protein